MDIRLPRKKNIYLGRVEINEFLINIIIMLINIRFYIYHKYTFYGYKNYHQASQLILLDIQGLCNESDGNKSQ